MTIFYTSDSHFSHANIIKYAGRPFSSPQEMDEILIQRWNEVVKPHDHVWHLGDVAMGKNTADGNALIRIMRRLLGHKRLILGNHDYFGMETYRACGFQKIQSSHRMDQILFTHIPIHPLSMGRHIANVHGHIHEQPAFKPVARQQFKDNWDDKPPVSLGFSPYINICVEQTHYRPISLEEVKDLIKKAS